MISNKTTFILGAGASNDFNFPIGKDLIRLMVDILAIPTGVDGSRNPTSREQNGLLNCFKILGCRDSLLASRNIANALPYNLSIDNFLKDRNEKLFHDISKIAISYIISNVERDLFSDRSAEPKWVADLISIIKDGYDPTMVEKVFEHINFITFNYDRSLEYMLTLAIRNAYSLNIDHAFDIVKKSSIIHPYGSLGELDPFVEFVMDKDSLSYHYSDKIIYEMSKNIRTFSEIIDNGVREKIRNTILNSDRLIFLGFGYHKNNIDLLSVSDQIFPGRFEIISTCFGESKDSIRIIKSRLDGAFKSSAEFYDGKSSEFLNEYKRRLLDY